MIVLLTAAIAILAAALAITIFGGRSTRRRLLELELRAARGERQAAGEFLDRLRPLRRCVEVLYLSGLPVTRSRLVFHAFAEGVKQVTRNRLDLAVDTWQGALGHSRGSEKVALQFLVGACLFASERRSEARAALDAALVTARKARDRYGITTTLYSQGMLARADGRCAEALADFDLAARLWGELDELREQSRALARAAEMLENQGNVEKALARHRDVLRLSEQSGDAVRAVQAFISTGKILAGQGNLDAARGTFENGLALARRAGDRPGEVELLALGGGLCLRQRDYKRGLELFERALRHHGDSRTRASEAGILAGLAQASEGLGRADVAGEYYERALERAGEEGERALQAVCLVGLAAAAQRHGALEKAHSLLDQAVELDRSSASEVQLGRHLIQRAVLAVEMHDPAGAARDVDEAFRLAERTDCAELQLRSSVVEIRMLAEDGRLSEAREKLRLLADAAGAVREPELSADYRFEAGHIARASGDKAQALDDWRAAVEEYGQAGLMDSQARARMFLAEALAEAGNLEEAGAAAEEALMMIHRSGTRKDEIRALRAVAFVEARGNRTRDAHRTLDRAIAMARETRDRWSEAGSLLALGRLAREVGVLDPARDNLVAARRLFGDLGAAVRVIEIDREIEQLPAPDTGVSFVDRDH
ncbi:MAG: tetratricopeptide repeat protein [bacterium]